MLINWPCSIQLGMRPTPVQAMPRLSRLLAVGPMLIKRDDLSADEFGGCKVRGLELYLSAAAEAGARTLLLSGFAGSNCIAAASLFARRFGLSVCAVVKPQCDSREARANLTTALGAGAEFTLVNDDISLRSSDVFMQTEFARLSAAGRAPYLIPFGGSGSLGAVAHTLAGLELAEQIASGAAPCPERIYVAAASMTTASGLLLGMALARLKIQLIIVAVLDPADVSSTQLVANARRAECTLRDRNPGLFEAELTTVEWEFRYAVCSPACRGDGGWPLAAHMAFSLEGIALDSVYTSKAFSLMLRDRLIAPQGDRPWLFWHTGSGKAGSSERDAGKTAESLSQYLFTSAARSCEKGHLNSVPAEPCQRYA